jgi:hypothetical protein
VGALERLGPVVIGEEDLCDIAGHRREISIEGWQGRSIALNPGDSCRCILRPGDLK